MRPCVDLRATVARSTRGTRALTGTPLIFCVLFSFQGLHHRDGIFFLRAWTCFISCRSSAEVSNRVVHASTAGCGAETVRRQGGMQTSERGIHGSSTSPPRLFFFFGAAFSSGSGSGCLMASVMSAPASRLPRRSSDDCGCAAPSSSLPRLLLPSSLSLSSPPPPPPHTKLPSSSPS